MSLLKAPLMIVALWLAACAAAPRSGKTPSALPAPAAAQAPTGAAPRSTAPSKHGLRPCLADDLGACGASSKPSTLNTLESGQRYEVLVDPGDPTWGPKDAAITVVVFSDYECPYCKHLKPTLKRLRAEFPHVLRVVWKDMPLPSHPFAAQAARLGRSAYAKGGDALFWKANEFIYDNQESLDEAQLSELALQLGVPWPTSDELNAHLEKDWSQVETLNVRSTPTSFVNGRPIFGAKAYGVFEKLVNEELARLKD
ncbi:MAG: hypothetical protein RJA70_3613 [Pseudomonadota bacterium]|jgi:protein-disulfide isomerase